MPKTRSARETLERVNPTGDVRIHEARLGPDNVADLFSGYDLIVDGSDNFATRYLINDAAHLAGKTVVSGSLLRFEGQLTTYRSGVKGHAGEPCYRCLFREPPPAGTGAAPARRPVYSGLSPASSGHCRQRRCSRS